MDGRAMTPENEKHLNAIATSLDDIPWDEQVQQGGELIDALRDTIGKVAAVRGAAMRELRRDSTLQELADRFGLSPQRIAQILDR